jgi:hypothetical protein
MKIIDFSGMNGGECAGFTQSGCGIFVQQFVTNYENERLEDDRMVAVVLLCVPRAAYGKMVVVIWKGPSRYELAEICESN